MRPIIAIYLAAAILLFFVVVESASGNQRTDTGLIVIFGIVIVVVFLVFAKKKFIAAEAKVTIADIAAIFEKLRTVGKDGSFAVFAFNSPGTSSPREAINLQFSVEHGQIGFDWVLLGPPNIRDKEKFVRLAEKLGYKPVACEMNKVKYLRVEGDGLPRLCEASIRDLYSMPPDTDLNLIPEGFTWP